ncbi:MAG: TonB-dependent receptor [Tidjanibacter sp.]|nr:TonB-dependent receptor [Tidjanibacter sp.]
MKRLIVTLLCLCVSFGFLRAQESDSLRTVEVEEIVVRSARSLRDIGVQKSIMSEVVLKENLAASMAEILAQNSTIFIKSSGRATLATASLRGTAPSHTSVTWNGIELGSPMLGMTDFSLIPSYFVDNSEVFHGASSVNAAGGGLGGAIVLSTSPQKGQQRGVQYVQNLASFSTHDEFVRVDWGSEQWHSTTRVLNSASKNNFPYINYDKVGHPLEYNTNCGYSDLHLLEELYWGNRQVGEFALKGWVTNSSRGIPRLTVDYRNDNLTKAWQDENSLRAVVEWKRSFGGLRLSASAGYNHNTLHYIYQFSKGGGEVDYGVDATSNTQHGFATTSAEWSIGNRLMLSANLKGSVFGVESQDVAPLVPTGYTAQREEASSFLSARWKPTEWLGVAASLREEWRDGVWSPLIPALFVDATLIPQIGLIVSGSVTRNYHAPTLNDLYYVPGGNPNLRPELGVSYDVGVESNVERERWDFGAKVTLYQSDISDWIMWTPTIKGFWTPENIAAVKSRGVESRAKIGFEPNKESRIELNAIVAITSSTNADTESDSYGKQLPYIPLYSASAGLRCEWRQWEMNYKWRYYSERYTTYSGTSFNGSSVPEYSLSDVSLSRDFQLKNKVRFKVRLEVNNLFDTYYQSVLSRPMPPRNYAIALECKFGL